MIGNSGENLRTLGHGGKHRRDVLEVVGLAENKANSALLGLQLRLNLTKSYLASAFEESVKLSASHRNKIVFAPTSNSPNVTMPKMFI